MQNRPINRPVTSLAMGFEFSYSTRHVFPPTEVTNPIKRAINYPYKESFYY